MKIGIIYKLTILAKYKFYGQRPFYVGQHWGIEDFNSYFGGGTIWNDFLNAVKKDYPLHWKSLFGAKFYIKVRVINVLWTFSNSIT